MSNTTIKSTPVCDDPDPRWLPLREALQRIEATIQPVAEVETVALKTSFERILAEDVRSPIDVPPHTNSAMDGFALAGAELPKDRMVAFDVVGTAWAGKPFTGKLNPGQAVRIMTGAVMPPGADTVVMQEQAELDGDRVRIGTGHKLGQNVRSSGEDLREGQVVLPAGTRILPAELGLLGSLGVADVAVKRRVRVACISTGNELRSVGEPLEPGAIYDSNRYTLHGMLSRLGAEIIDMGVVRDERAAIRETLLEAAGNTDVIITSGGVSAGAADYVTETLKAEGEVGFWRIAIRPGRPLAFGRLGQAVFFGLPGNPVAVMTTFYQLVQPALIHMMGETASRPGPAFKVPCISRLRKKPGRTEYYRAVLEHDESGNLVVRSTGPQGSGLLHTMSAANCFVVLPDGASTVEPGELVEVQSFYGLV